jgi:hypothetical protein
MRLNTKLPNTKLPNTELPDAEDAKITQKKTERKYQMALAKDKKIA